MNQVDIKDHFREFNKNLIIQTKEIEKIDKRKSNITKMINEKYWGALYEDRNSKNVGSYGRKTAIKSSDIDLLVILPDSEKERFESRTNNSESALLYDLRQKLKDLYPNSDIRARGQVVVIDFTDNNTFEILPAFYDPVRSGYYFPNANNGGKWELTFPDKDQRILNEMNKKRHFHLKRCCRMARAWKSECNVPLSGIGIDSLLREIFELLTFEVDYTNYDQVADKFFTELEERASRKQGITSLDGTFKIELSDEIESKARTAKKNVDKANLAGTNEEAEDYWRKIFGRSFPKLEASDAKNSFDSIVSLRFQRMDIGNANDTEEFCKDKWEVDSDSFTRVKISGFIKTKGFQNRILKFLENIHIAKDTTIDFSVPDEPGIEWYWKVRNVGNEANAKNCIRGQIIKGKHQRTESVDFRGHHYVEVFGIRNNKIVKAGHIDVPFVDKW